MGIVAFHREVHSMARGLDSDKLLVADFQASCRFCLGSASDGCVVDNWSIVLRSRSVPSALNSDDFDVKFYSDYSRILGLKSS
jgi:hypothetical protein